MSIDENKKLLNIDTSWKGEELFSFSLEDVNLKYKEAAGRVAKAVKKFTLTQKPKKVVLVALFHSGSTALFSGENIDVAINKMMLKAVSEEKQ